MQDVRLGFYLDDIKPDGNRHRKCDDERRFDLFSYRGCIKNIRIHSHRLPIRQNIQSKAFTNTNRYYEYMGI